jgi:hypothetical protein
MTTHKFAPKDADTLKSEILTDLGIEYDGNEDMIDKLVERELKSEQFKASLHEDKTKHLKGKDYYKKKMEEAGLDPKTGKPKQITKEEETKVSKNYSLQDIRALNKVHDDDIERVERFAKLEGIEISEALKNPDLQAILANREEQRKTADATNVSGSRRGSTKVSPETILDDFEKGNAPEKDEDIMKLAEARIARKKAIKA